MRRGSSSFVNVLTRYGVIFQSYFANPFSRLMTRQKKIFLLVALIFTLVVALFALDMARRTTAPWNKKKQIDRVLPVTPK